MTGPSLPDDLKGLRTGSSCLVYYCFDMVGHLQAKEGKNLADWKKSLHTCHNSNGCPTTD